MKSGLWAADLADPTDCQRKLASLKDVSHVFFAAYLEKPTPQEAVAANLGMLRNLVDAIEPGAANLQHINLVESSKWYGSHLGPYKTPVKESDPRVLPKQDHSVNEQGDRVGSVRMHWSSLRFFAGAGIRSSGSAGYN